MRKKLLLGLLLGVGNICCTHASEQADIIETPMICNTVYFDSKSMGYMRIKASSRHIFQNNLPDDEYDLVQLKVDFSLQPILKLDGKENNDSKEKEDEYSSYFISLKPTQSGVIPINYNPNTVGEVTAFSSGKEGSFSAGFGLFGFIPTFNLGIDSGTSIGESHTYPPLEIITNLGEDGEVSWELRQQGKNRESVNGGFKGAVDVSWKVTRAIDDHTSVKQKEETLPISLTLQQGVYSRGNIKWLKEDKKEKFINFVKESLEKFLPEDGSWPYIDHTFGGNKPKSIWDQRGNDIFMAWSDNHWNDSSSQPPLHPILSKESYVLGKKSNPSSFSILLSPRSNTWFLTNNVTGFRCGIQPRQDGFGTPSFAQHRGLIYGAYVDTQKDFLIVTSEDTIHWNSFKTKLNATSSSNWTSAYPSIISHNEDLIVGGRFGDEGLIKLYKLADNESIWKPMDVPDAYSKIGDVRLTSFKGKLHVFSIDESGHINVMVNILGNKLSKPQSILALSEENLAKTNIAVAATDNKIYIAYPQKLEKLEESSYPVIFATSDTGLGNWRFKNLEFKTSEPLELLRRGNILHLFTTQKDTNDYSVHMNQYFIKENKWQKLPMVFKPSSFFIPYYNHVLNSPSTDLEKTVVSNEVAKYSEQIALPTIRSVSPFTVHTFDLPYVSSSRIYVAFPEKMNSSNDTNVINLNYFENERDAISLID